MSIYRDKDYNNNNNDESDGITTIVSTNCRSYDNELGQINNIDDNIANVTPTIRANNSCYNDYQK